MPTRTLTTMTSDCNKFRKWVKTRLIVRELTVADLADAIGYPRRTVSAAINGATFPHVLNSIATHLEYDPKTDGPLPARPARAERRLRVPTR